MKAVGEGVKGKNSARCLRLELCETPERTADREREKEKEREDKRETHTHTYTHTHHKHGAAHALQA